MLRQGSDSLKMPDFLPLGEAQLQQLLHTRAGEPVEPVIHLGANNDIPSVESLVVSTRAVETRALANVRELLFTNGSLRDKSMQLQSLKLLAIVFSDSECPITAGDDCPVTCL